MPAISDLTSAVSLAGTEVFPVVQSGVTKKAAISLVTGACAASAAAAAASATAAAASAALLATIPDSYDGSRDPTTTDDTTQGTDVGSPWLNTTTQMLFECVDNTTNAARWIRISRDGPKMLTSTYYPTFTGIHNTGTAVVAVDILYVYPFIVGQKITVTSLNSRCVTGGAGSETKMGVWADKNGRPFGAPVVAGNTGAATTANNSTATCTATGVLYPGTYWVGAKFTGTLPSMLSISSTDYSIENMVGRATINGNTALTALSIAATYASDLPTFDGTEVWTDHLTGGVPGIRVGL